MNLFINNKHLSVVYTAMNTITKTVCKMANTLYIAPDHPVFVAVPPRVSHPVSSATELLSLLAELFDDVRANLLALHSDALAACDALRGVVQRLGALDQ